MSSAPGTAFTNPSAGKIDQQRKILEELERRKKQLNQQSSSMSASTNNIHNNAAPANAIDPPAILFSNTQRAAMELATKSSFGFFIPQDSSFGNLILPVIPRLNPSQPQQQQ